MPSEKERMMESKYKKTNNEREHFCFNCGESLGFYYGPSDPLDNCGRSECAREARYAYESEKANYMEAAERDFDARFGY